MAVLELAGVKAHLNMKDTVVTYDSELQGMIDATVPGLERQLGGPVVNREITEPIMPTDAFRALVLTYRRFVSLTSISVNGLSVSTADVYASPGRVLRRRFGLPFMPYWPMQPWDVTYVAGFGETAPAEAVLAGKVIVAHLWTTQRGRSGGRGPSANNEYATSTTWAPGFGFAIPNFALQLLDSLSAETGLA